MKDRALQIVAARPPAADAVNVLREYLQSRVLGLMQARGAFIPLAFMGGTALRFRYGIERFSEDLDFTLERERDRFDFQVLADSIERGLTLEGYDVQMRVSENTAVKKMLIAFEGLLAEAGISPMAAEKLRIKLEVDTNPPAGATFDTSVVRRFDVLRIQFHDLSSLFAGKTAAVLARSYTKGRDYYDLAWYLSREPVPEMNTVLLRNALEQTAPEIAQPAATDWKSLLRERVRATDWDAVWRDVAPFLESPERDRSLFSSEAFEGLLERLGGDVLS